MKRVILLAACAVVGCSFTVQAPPKNYTPERHGYPDCDRDAPGRVFFDGLSAGMYMVLPVGFAGAVVSGEIDGEDSDELLGPALLLVAMAALHGGAIVHQSKTTARCQAAHLEYARWYNRNRGAL